MYIRLAVEFATWLAELCLIAFFVLGFMFTFRVYEMTIGPVLASLVVAAILNSLGYIVAYLKWDMHPKTAKILQNIGQEVTSDHVIMVLDLVPTESGINIGIVTDKEAFMFTETIHSENVVVWCEILAADFKRVYKHMLSDHFSYSILKPEDV